MFENENFQILYHDDHFVAINKPPGILVHRTSISEDTRFVLQILRDQLGKRIYPVHRLDRGTSGVLVFGKDKEAAGRLSEQFRERKVEKKYLAIVRGHLEAEGIIDYALANKEVQVPQRAVTRYKRLAETEINAAISRYPASRYSLVEIKPETGKRHQIRRHFAHIRHPVIGDKKHGDCKHNKYFREVLGIERMLLHALELSFAHPMAGQRLTINAPLDATFFAIIKKLELSES